MHSGGLEHTQLTHSLHEDNRLHYRGDWVYHVEKYEIWYIRAQYFRGFTVV